MDKAHLKTMVNWALKHYATNAIVRLQLTHLALGRPGDEAVDFRMLFACPQAQGGTTIGHLKYSTDKPGGAPKSDPEITTPSGSERAFLEEVFRQWDLQPGWLVGIEFVGCSMDDHGRSEIGRYDVSALQHMCRLQGRFSEIADYAVNLYRDQLAAAAHRLHNVILEANRMRVDVYRDALRNLQQLT